MRRFSGSLIMMLLITQTTFAAVEVEQADKQITMANDVVSITLDLSKGCGNVRAVRLAADEQKLCQRSALAIWFKHDNHWVDESWVKPTRTPRIKDVDDGKTLQIEVDNFGGFQMRKAITMRSGSPVIQFSYHLVAPAESLANQINPLAFTCPPELDRLITPTGEVAAADIKVSNWAMKVNHKWYAFASAATGKGIAVVPLVWPKMYQENTIGKQEDGSLSVYLRCHTQRKLPAGTEVSFSYNLVPFAGDPTPFVEMAQQAGPGPIEPLPSVALPPDPAALPQGLRVAYCPPLPAAPTLDGKIDEACWQQAGVLDNFLSVKGDRFAEVQTTTRVGLHDGVLYVAARCEEPLMDQLQTDAAPGSTVVWTDDCVELFIDTAGDGKAYAHLIVNAAGVRQDNLPGERGVQYQWTAAAARGEDFWSIEAAIPLADLDTETPGDGSTWRFNVCRHRLPQRELSCWSATLKGFHVPHRFGVLAFGSPDVRVVHILPGLQAQQQQRKLALILENATAEAIMVSGEVTITRDGEELTRLPVNATVPARRKHALDVPYETAQPGQYRVDVSVEAPAQRQTIIAAAFGAQVYSAGLNSAIYPIEADENRLYVAKGTVQHFFFVSANHSEKTYDNYRFVLELPEGVEVIQASSDYVPYYIQPTLTGSEQVERDGQKLVKWTWEAGQALGKREIGKTRFFESWCGALIPPDDLPEGTHKFYFYLEARDEREPAHTGELIVLPEPEGRQPQEIVIGMEGWTLSPTLEFFTGLIETYRKCGINLMMSHIQAKRDEYAQVVRAAGMRPWESMFWFWKNGAYLKEHPEHTAINFDGEPAEGVVCPEILASTETDAIAHPMDTLVERARAERLEGTWWDLEGPNVFSMCFCPRCLQAFRESADIPADEELTPIKIQAKYPDQWTDFACGQSARIAARMRSYARAAGVDWKLAAYSGVQSGHTRRSYRVDWTTLSPHIDVASPSFYSFSAGALGSTFTRGVTSAVEVVRGVSDIPVWSTLSTGFGRGHHFLSDGRVTRMQIIKSIAFGADGTVQWWWGPTDGRHYAAYAEATALIAELEEFFTQGEMQPQLLSGDEVPGTSRVAWQLQEKALVMFFNDGTSGPVTVTAQVPEGCHMLKRDGRRTSRLVGKALTMEIEPLDCRWVILALPVP